MSTFTSQGFDLDALSNVTSQILDDEGNVSTIPVPVPSPPLPQPPKAICKKALHVQFKESGNALFLAGDYPASLVQYQLAIAEAEKLSRSVKECGVEEAMKKAEKREDGFVDAVDAGEDDFQDADDGDEDNDERHDTANGDHKFEGDLLFGLRLVDAKNGWHESRRCELQINESNARRKNDKDKRVKNGDRPEPGDIEIDSIIAEEGQKASASASDEKDEAIFAPLGGWPHLSKELSTYHSNASASLHNLRRYNETIEQCDIALAYDSGYVKAFIRRSKAREKVANGNGFLGGSEEGDIDGALSDVKAAIEIIEGRETPEKGEKVLLLTLKADRARLQKLNDAKMEKLKDETLGKLKDMGNSILSNFGMSLDNFKTVKDEKGGYSIQFNQGK